MYQLIRMHSKTICFSAFLALATGAGFAQDVNLKVKLTPSVASPAPVGQSILWTANAGHLSGRATYRFLAGANGGSLRIIRDFSPINTLPWSELTEGTYRVAVMVRDGKSFGENAATFIFQSRVTAGTPVVSATQNPLVALYSVPSCAVGGTVQVSFWQASGSAASAMTTPAQNCNGSTSLNFYVAGMLPSTAYTLQQTMTANGTSQTGPQMSFQTGAVNYPMPAFNLGIPPNKKTAAADGVLLMSYKALKSSPPLFPSPTALDLNGNVLWYYWDPESPKGPQSEYMTRPVEGGTFLIQMWGGEFREVDLAGNIVHETNVPIVDQQLKAKGTDTPDWFSHEGLRLPNGHTVTLGSAERLLTNVQGPGTVDVVGDMIIDLDENFQVAWSWSSFDFLNTSRKAVLDEKCGTSSEGVDKCGHLRLASVANDWTHANSLFLTSDGNLLISLRNQDYIVKLDYENGTGDGHVIWTLGNEGNCATPGCTSPSFTLQTPVAFYQDAWPWFSHQHDIEFDGTNYEVYDNGNTRVSAAPVGLGSGDSRGYVFAVDEVNLTVTVNSAVDLKSFNPGFGSAQLLANGDYQFTNGTINDGLNSQVIEETPSGTFDYQGSWKTRSYRSFRLPDLYTYTE